MVQSGISCALRLPSLSRQCLDADWKGLAKVVAQEGVRERENAVEYRERDAHDKAKN